MKRRLIILALLSMLFMTLSVRAGEKVTEERLDEVAERGAHVMPFSLEQTIHIFSKTAAGGLQQVLAKDSSNIEQVELIREHLSKISQEFIQGDFSDPAKIHGADMPGLAELRMAEPGQIKIVYKELSNGAEIDYSANETKLIEAIHKWFDAQLSNHARHAIPGHPHHHIHQNP